jgi:hypothetical protein
MKHLVIIFWQGSKRASSPVAEKPPMKHRKETIDLTDIDKQVYSFSFELLFLYMFFSLTSISVFDRTLRLILAELLPKFRAKSIHLSL